MKLNLLSALACTSLLSASATADLHQSSSWLQGPQSNGFGLGRVDIDDESGGVSAVIDFQGLTSPVTGGRLVSATGKTLCNLSPQSGPGGVVFGTTVLAPSELASLLQGPSRLLVETTLHPLGEVHGDVSVQPASFLYPLTSSQVSPGHSSTAHGNGYLFQSPLGEAAFSGQLFGLQGTITSIEIRRNAWYGQPGIPMLPVIAIGYPTPAMTTFHVLLPAPTPEERRDVHDGMCYVIVRTSLFPDGELRGQIRAPSLGDRYCAGRPNSVSTQGAWMSFEGSPLASANDIRIRGFDLPPGKLVLPILGLGSVHAFNPGGLGGMLCVGGSGIARLQSGLATAGASGTFDATLDLSNFSIGGTVHSLAPGMRLNFQLWHRDPQGPSSSNLSSAVSVVFH